MAKKKTGQVVIYADRPRESRSAIRVGWVGTPSRDLRLAARLLMREMREVRWVLEGRQREPGATSTTGSVE